MEKQFCDKCGTLHKGPFASHECSSSGSSDCSTATNPMLNLLTTCGRCDLLCEVCAVVTVKTVHKGYDTVELCRKCLSEISNMIDFFTRKQA